MSDIDLAARLAALEAEHAELEKLRARHARCLGERDEARANYQFMVERAADQNLQHYRQLGEETVSALNRADAAEDRLARLQHVLQQIAESRHECACDHVTQDCCNNANVFCSRCLAAAVLATEPQS